MPSITGPVTGLINEISDSVSALVDDLTGRERDPNVPSQSEIKGVSAVLSTINQGNWMKLTFPYTFSVVDIAGGTQNPFSDFSLPLAPNMINQNEEFAISIKSTQGGTTVTHTGNKYKTLNIEGTTGIAPFRGTGGVTRQDGEAIFTPDQLKYRSGYEVFLRFRNWLRAYYEHKKIAGINAQGLRLVFKNYKDGEFLIVELLNFEMDKQAERTWLYDYKCEFKVLAHLNFVELENRTSAFESALEDANNFIQQARGVFLRSQGILRQIESTYESVILEPLRQATLAIKALQGIGTTAADVGNRIINNTVDAATTLAIAVGIQSQFTAARRDGGLDPALQSVTLPNDLESAVSNQGSAFLNTLGEGLTTVDSSQFSEETRNALNEEQATAQNLPRSFYQETIQEVNRVRQNAEDFFNVGDSDYDALFDRTATLEASFAKVPTQEELDVLNAFTNAVTGINLLLATEDLFRSSFDEKIQDMVDRFQGNISLFANTAVKQIQLNAGETLERIAQRELGDSNRWGEIAEVNNLKPPYIIDDPSDTRSNVVKPGDKLLVPTPIQDGFSQVPNAPEIKTTRGFNELEKSLGSDLKLTSDFDLSLTSSGDLEIVSGADNMAQAVLLKLSYEPGEVIRYPEMGAGLQPGIKTPPLEDIQDNLVNTLLQDTRIRTISNLSIRQENGTFRLRFNLFIKQVDIPIPVDIKVA